MNFYSKFLIKNVFINFLLHYILLLWHHSWYFHDTFCIILILTILSTPQPYVAHSNWGGITFISIYCMSPSPSFGIFVCLALCIWSLCRGHMVLWSVWAAACLAAVCSGWHRMALMSGWPLTPLNFAPSNMVPSNPSPPMSSMGDKWCGGSDAYPTSSSRLERKCIGVHSRTGLPGNDCRIAYLTVRLSTCTGPLRGYWRFTFYSDLIVCL